MRVAKVKAIGWLVTTSLKRLNSSVMRFIQLQDSYNRHN